MNELVSLTENKSRIEQKRKDDNSLSFLKTFVSRDTYFVLSPNQLERLKQISEAIFKLANETLLEIIKQNEVESWMESRYEKNFKILELNTGSSAGWEVSGLIEKEASAYKIGAPLAPPPMILATYLQIESMGGDARIFNLIETSFQDIIDFAPTGIFWRCHERL
ncbi:14987_t:CDS:2, partial [Dentiscutata erythropus]